MRLKNSKLSHSCRSSDCPPRRNIKGSSEPRIGFLRKPFFPSSLPSKAACVGVDVRAQSSSTSRASLRASLEGIMGALMVIFSLQPKQKAKTKGRSSFATFTVISPFVSWCPPSVTPENGVNPPPSSGFGSLKSPSSLSPFRKPFGGNSATWLRLLPPALT